MQSKPKSAVPVLESDGHDLFVIYNGVRVAKRGHPGTAQARKWVSLEPDFTVYDSSDGGEIVIEHGGVRVHLRPPAIGGPG